MYKMRNESKYDVQRRFYMFELEGFLKETTIEHLIENIGAATLRENVYALIRNGANVNECAKKLLSPHDARYLPLLLNAGANPNICAEQISSSALLSNLELLIKFGLKFGSPS
jgi:hypothetical protein